MNKKTYAHISEQHLNLTLFAAAPQFSFKYFGVKFTAWEKTMETACHHIPETSHWYKSIQPRRRNWQYLQLIL